MLCRAVRDEAAADSVWQCAGVRCSSQVAGRPAGCCPECGGEVWQSCAGAVQAVGKGAVRAPVQAAVGAAVAKSGKEMLCMPGKGSLCRVLGNQQVLELRTRGFKIEKNFVSNV